MTGAVDVQQTGASERGIFPENLRIEKIIIDAPVDHVDAFRAARRAHVDELVPGEQVLSLHQFDAHLLRQKRVFEIGAVVHAGREDHHRRLGGGGRAGRTQGFQQQVGIVGYRRDPVCAEELGEKPHRHLAVFQHVTHTAWNAQVVFQHVVLAFTLAIRSPHDVHARNMRIHVAGYLDTDHFGTKLGVCQDLITRDQARLEDLLVVIDVMDKTVQSRHPLYQSLFNTGPFVGRDDAGNQIERNQAFIAGAVFVLGAVDREGNADAAKNQLGLLAPLDHHVTGLARQPFIINFVMLPYLFTAREELVRHGGIHLVEFMHEHLLLM